MLHGCRLKSGQAIPIAVLVKTIVVKKRLDIVNLVKTKSPARIAQSINEQIQSIL